MVSCAPDAQLEDREVAVWYSLTRSLDEAAVGAMSDVLSSDERERRDRFVFAHDRRDFAAGHVLLRRTLSRYNPVPASEWRFRANEFGKPSIRAPDQEAEIAFNLSHTTGLVACAIGRGTRIGVDVERVRQMPDLLDIAQRFFAPSEVRSLGEIPSDGLWARFAELWTLKESYIKAVGGGLSLPLDTFAFEFDASGLCFSAKHDGSGWQFLLAAPTADTRLAVAVDRGRSAAYRRISVRSAAPSAGGTEELQILAAGGC